MLVSLFWRLSAQKPLPQPKIYYTGYQPDNMNDYKTLVDDVTSGKLLETISKHDIDHFYVEET